MNNVPVVNAGVDYIIPAHTPFTLSGSATDEDNNDSLTYSWQQIDLGTISHSASEQIDDGSRPLFRVWPPTGSPQRTLPQLSAILSSSTAIGETYATTDRLLNFRLLVRDARGGVGFDDNKLTVVNTNEAFAVTTPTIDMTWSSQHQIVNWQTASTQNSPISCAKVDILLSTDGGINFTIQLAAQVDNDGSFEVSIPSAISSQSRIKVACSNNIFFAISSGNFNIDFQSTQIEPPMITGQTSISIVEGSSITLTMVHFTFSGSTVDKITVLNGNNYTVVDNTVTANSAFVGILNITVTAHSGDLVSEVFVSKVSVTAKTVSPTPNRTSSSGGIFWLLSLLILLVFYRQLNRRL